MFYEEEYEPFNTEEYDALYENSFHQVSMTPLSTFAADVDTASYANLRRMIMQGYQIGEIPSGAVRAEEMVNYFRYDYDGPKEGEPFGVNAVISDCPWNPAHKLLMLGLQTEEIDFSEAPNTNLVLLIDVSGSMDEPDKLPLLQEALGMLIDELGEKDRVSIVTYASSNEIVLDGVPGSNKEKIMNAVNSLEAYGSTNGGEGIISAYKLAEKSFIEGGNNRVIIASDGDFNVGVSNTDDLVEMVQDYAGKGIYMTVCGFGRGNLNDSMMESISNNGNGTYEYIASEDDMTKVFVNERSEFFAVANDAKVQITLDRAKVAKYRLIGYENRILSQEDFENDEKDAGEIGSGQTITALYEIVPAEGAAEGSWATFDFRYKKSLSEASIPLTLEVAPAAEFETSTEFSFAAGVAAYGMILRNSPYMGTATFDMAYELVQGGTYFDPFGYRADLLNIIKQAKQIAQ
jgi:Ca-activated chloride channel family protein